MNNEDDNNDIEDEVEVENGVEVEDVDEDEDEDEVPDSPSSRQVVDRQRLRNDFWIVFLRASFGDGVTAAGMLLGTIIYSFISLFLFLF